MCFMLGCKKDVGLSLEDLAKFYAMEEEAGEGGTQTPRGALKTARPLFTRSHSGRTC